MNLKLRLSFVFVLCLVVSNLSLAQVSTGTPPFGSFAATPAGTINLGNLNLHLSVPILNKKGRGTDFKYSVSYDSSIWYPVAANGTTSWTPVAGFGWPTGSGITGKVTYSTTAKLGGTCSYEGRKYTKRTYTYSNFVFTDRDNVIHLFSPDNIVTDVYCSGDYEVYSGFTDSALDGSGIVLDTQTEVPGKIRFPSGTTILNDGKNVSTDRTGNQISFSNGVFTDTLGKTAMTLSGMGTPTSPNLMQYAAPGGGATAKLIYTTYNVKTAFGCSGVSEYSKSQNLVSELLLADGTFYTFAYEPTPGDSSSVTGRIAQITLPTGGSVSFSYLGSGTGISNGVVCSDGSTAGMSVQTPDGTTTYTRTQGSGTAWTTAVTAADAQSSQEMISFQEASSNFYETSRTIYQGSNTLLRTIAICYNGDKAAPNCSADAIKLPILSKAVYVGLPSLSGLQSEQATTYNTSGLVTQTSYFDYGLGTPGALLKKEAIQYLQYSSFYLPQSDTISDGNGNVVAQTTYGYDEGQVVGTTGTPQHLWYAYPGDLTSVVQKVSSSATLTYGFTYFDNGMLNTATDPNGGVTTYTYGACGNSFPTLITGPTGLTSHAEWDCDGGVALNVTDANGQVSRTGYTDPYFWRPSSVTDPIGNSTTYSYTGTPSVESALTFNSGNSASDRLITLDSLGRTAVVQTRRAPGSPSFDSVSYAYDSMGRLGTTTLPYAAGQGVANSSGSGATVTYDALGRKVLESNAGGKWKSYSYNQNDILVTVGPAPLKKQQSEYDALGRLTSVCEITTASDGGPCGQNTSATGYLTKYTYNALGQILTVTQNAQSSGSQQNRIFTYDGLGRLTSETNPETNNTATTYVYDSDSCATSKGDLVKKLDPVGNASCITYDLAHRPVQVTYTGPYAANTPTKHFVYDAATVNGMAMSNTKGLLAEAYTGTPTSKITDLGFSYSARGELVDSYEKTPNSGSYFHVNTGYWANGAMAVLGLSLGTNSLLPAISYGPDGEGRTYSVSASSGQNPVTGTTYNPASQVTGITYGSSDSDEFGFEPNTGKSNGYKFHVNGVTVSGALTWNSNGSLGALKTTDPFNSANTQDCSYSHDDLGRTSGVNCAGENPWQQNFTYDAFGNMSKSGSLSFVAQYSPSTNRISLGIPNVSYDMNGNQTSILSDISHSYTWDADGNQIWADGTSITYDALDRAVEQSRSDTYTQIVYVSGTSKLALVSGGTLQKAFVPLPAGAAAVYKSDGLAFYRHPDWLGSSRMASTPTQTVYSSTAYAPFGEAYSESGTRDRSFTGQNQDTNSSQYDFLYRSYSQVQGRWLSPDPAGLGAVQPSNPQTWNRYAYVGNKPLEYLDPLGLDICIGGGGISQYDCNLMVQEKNGGGGVWVDGGIGSGGYITWAQNYSIDYYLDGEWVSTTYGIDRYNILLPVTGGGYDLGAYYLMSGSSGSGLSTGGTASPNSVSAVNPQPQLKPSCTNPALLAAAKAAGSDFFTLPGADPVGDIGDVLRDKNFQRAAVGTLYVAGRVFAPTAAVATKVIPVVGQAILLYQVGHALYEGGMAYKNSIDQCYGTP
jgi:RHS repeat-associated protein